MKRGFTLIELLVVVLIIGILSAVALPQYNKAVLRSKYVQLQVIARSFADAATVYYMANGQGPLYWSDMDIEKPGDWTDQNVELGYIGKDRSFCDLNTTHIVCFYVINESEKVAYARWFEPGKEKTECWSFESYKNGVGLCKSLGGVKTGTTEHGTCIGCNTYKLP